MVAMTRRLPVANRPADTIMRDTLVTRGITPLSLADYPGVPGIVDSSLLMVFS